LKIKWLAHAAFLIEGDGLRIITDPYEPNEIINLPPITTQADIVVRSSHDDVAHCFTGTLPSGYELVTATEIVECGVTAKDLRIDAVWSQESLIHKDVAGDNAMYRFTIEGINIAHMGDVGNPLSQKQLDALAGVDVLLALTGGPPTIELDDLAQVIDTIQPGIVIPMHYRIPGPRFFMLPVTEFIGRYPSDMVHWLNTSDLTLTRGALPSQTQIYVLQPSLMGET
jgi:L-ascorbate metabolism protein UlaG (beta-lactamase superfamily)